MKIRISQSQVQKTILAPSMQQSIEVLLLPVMELNMAIDQELSNNPLLEIDEEKTTEKNTTEEWIQQKIYKENYSPRERNFDYQNDENMEGKPVTRHVPLEDSLLEQIRLELTDPLELKIAEYIIGNLDQDGYLKTDCQEIAQAFNIQDIYLVEYVLKIIQSFEPIGIASRNLKECLLTQVYYKFNGQSQLITRIISDHLDDLGHKRFLDIARAVKISVDQVKEIAQIISTLEPKPARNSRPINDNIYIQPDVIVIKDEENNYHIHITRFNIPQLRISQFYQNMLRQSNRTKEEVDFIREKIKNGLLFIKSIEQRYLTIEAITKYILDYQKDFFELGSMALKPLTLKDVALFINRNESTVCRAISNKYMDTPQGLLPMKHFFSQGVSEDADGNGSVSNRTIKEAIKNLIDEENKTHPLSDQEIQLHFEKKGTRVARRTINKYRQALHILPSHLRKN